MRLCPLAKVQHQVKLAAPLPFGIRDAGGRLLLARGISIAEQEQFDALLDRGAFVDLDEIQGARAEILRAPPERLPVLWRAFIERVDAALHAPPSAQWAATLEDHARTLLALTDRCPDLAIFLIVRRDGPERTHYGVLHAVHAAAAGVLVARRLGHDETRTLALVRAALTMNLAVLDLQGRLAEQPGPPTALQRDALRQHPVRSAAMLQAVGVNDEAWIDAVLRHHEPPAARGDLAEMLHVCDVFTAKFAPRATRAPMPGNQAAKAIFTTFPQSAASAALVKEFGIYPPGCYVALEGGEQGVVVKRGAAANTPLVDVLLGRNGEPTLAPVRRDTSYRSHAIVQMVPEARFTVRVAPERLFAERG